MANGHIPPGGRMEGLCPDWLLLEPADGACLTPDEGSGVRFGPVSRRGNGKAF